MSYVDDIYKQSCCTESCGRAGIPSGSKEVLDSLKLVIDANEEKYRKAGVLAAFPHSRKELFPSRVPWVDDKGNVQVNKGYRVQFNSAIGDLTRAVCVSIRL